MESRGGILGHGWSLAWRVYDAQYWGVPQRRKRIYLVADFAGERAGEILFECESVRGDPSQSREEGQGTAADAEGSPGRGSGTWAFKERAGKPGGGKGILPGYERGFTLSTNVDQHVAYALEAVSPTSPNSNDPRRCDAPENKVCYQASSFSGYEEGMGTLKASGGDVGGGSETLVVSVYDGRGNGDGVTVPTMAGDHFGRPGDLSAILMERYNRE